MTIKNQTKSTTYTIRKLTVGTASVAVASAIFLGGSALASDENNNANNTVNAENKQLNIEERDKAVDNTESSATNVISNSSNVSSDIQNSTKPKVRNKRELTEAATSENANTANEVIHNTATKTNNNLIQGKEFNGEYGFYLTAKDKSGKEYSSTYGGYSFLNLDNLDSDSIKGHFVLKNGDKDINSNLILTLPNYWQNGSSSLVYDNKEEVVINSKLGEDYSKQLKYGNKNGQYLKKDKYVETYGAEAFGEQLRAIRLDGGKIKANDEINFDFKLKLTKAIDEVQRELGTFSIYNFINGHNGYETDNLNIAMIHKEDINSGERVSKLVYPVYRKEHDVDGGANWTYVKELQEFMPEANEIFRFGDKNNNTIPEKSVDAEENAAGFYTVKTNDPDLAPYPNLSQYYFLLLDKAQKNISTHGYSVNPDRIDKNYYIYGGGNGITVENTGKVDEDMKELEENRAKFLHFQVIPSILLKENQTHTATSDGGVWDAKSMVKQFTNPYNVKWLIDETDSRQLDKSKLNVKITNVTPGATSETVSEVSLAKPGKYKVEYSYDFGTAEKPLLISNTGYVTVVSDYQQLNVRVLDDTDNKILTDTKAYSGKTNEEITDENKENIKTSLAETIKNYIDKGYKLLSEPTIPTKLDNTENFSTDTDNEIQYIDVHLIHDTRTETEYKASKQIIHYVGAGSKTPADKINVDDKAFSREITYDKVTNSIIGEPTEWKGEKSYDAIATPEIKGYTADKSSAGAGEVTPNNTVIEETVTYTKAPDKVEQESKTVTRNIKVIYPDGSTETIVQSVTFTRAKTIKPETDEVVYGSWSENGKHMFEGFAPREIEGYIVSKVSLQLIVTPESDDIYEEITYNKKVQPTPIDDNGKDTPSEDNNKPKDKDTPSEDNNKPKDKETSSEDNNKPKDKVSPEKDNSNYVKDIKKNNVKTLAKTGLENNNKYMFATLLFELLLLIMLVKPRNKNRQK